MNFASAIMANTVIESCDSTNDLARQLGEEGAAHGTWISARAQTGGRGRLGRHWQSLEGNLFLSIIVRPEHKALWTWVPLATAVALAETLGSMFSEIPVRVKWPNDLWVKGAKLGGILCEAVGGREGSFIAIGIGLNCAASPENLDQPATSLTAEAGRRIIADELRAEIVSSVLRWMDLDRQRIARGYDERAALLPGSAIEWAEGSRRGNILGLGPSGELRVSSKGGELSLFAEDVKIRAER